MAKMGPIRSAGGKRCKPDVSLEEGEAEGKRHETMVEILSEGVYAYLKRKGLLTAHGGPTGGKIVRDPAVMAGDRPMTGNAGERKILDE